MAQIKKITQTPFDKMPVEKAALAVIRHEQSFAAEDIYFQNQTRFVKFTKVWNSHRRFRNDFTLETFHQALSVSTRQNGMKTFSFYPQHEAMPDIPINFEQLWVAAP